MIWNVLHGYYFNPNLKEPLLLSSYNCSVKNG